MKAATDSTTTVATFEAGVSYFGRFITDSDSKLIIEVLARTPKTVTFEHPHTGELRRAKIHTHGGSEFFYPMGQHSMALTIGAHNTPAKLEELIENDRPVVVSVANAAERIRDNVESFVDAARKYYILVGVPTFNDHTRFEMIWGDYDRDEVESERQAYADEGVRQYKRMKVCRLPNAGHTAIDNRLDQLNKGVA